MINLNDSNNLKKILYPDDYLKNMICKIEKPEPSEIDEAIYNFYQNYKSRDILCNSFYQAKNLGIVTKYDNQTFLRDYYDFAYFNLTTLLFSFMLCRSMFKRKYISPSNKTQVIVLGISILFINELICVPLFYKKISKTISLLDKRYSPIIQKLKEKKINNLK